MIRRSHEEWEALFAKQASSGLSAAQFCTQQNLCPRYFSLRKKQLQWTAPKTFPVVQPRFVRVQKIRTPTLASMEKTHVILRHSRSEIEMHSVSPDWLAQLLMALA